MIDTILFAAALWGAIAWYRKARKRRKQEEWIRRALAPGAGLDFGLVKRR
jgi:hypothetical protein